MPDELIGMISKGASKSFQEVAALYRDNKDKLSLGCNNITANATVIYRKELVKRDVLQSHYPTGIIKTVKIREKLSYNAIRYLQSYKDREENEFSKKQTFKDPTTVRFKENIDIEDQLLIKTQAL